MNEQKKLSCRELEGFIVDFLDGELSKSERDRFIDHINLCIRCKDYLGNYKKSISLSQAVMSEKEDCASMPEELVSAILASRKK